jgi:hypothetical protein
MITDGPHMQPVANQPQTRVLFEAAAARVCNSLLNIPYSKAAQCMQLSTWLTACHGSRELCTACQAAVKYNNWLPSA